MSPLKANPTPLPVRMADDDRKRKGYGDGGIHGVTALLQNCDASLGAERFIGGDHGVRAAHRLLRPSVRRVGMFRRVVLEFGGGLRMAARSGEQ